MRRGGRRGAAPPHGQSARSARARWEGWWLTAALWSLAGATLSAARMPRRAPMRRSGAMATSHRLVSAPALLLTTSSGLPALRGSTPHLPCSLLPQAQSAARAAASPRRGAGGGARRAHARRGAPRPRPRAPCRLAGRLARLAARRPAHNAAGGGGAPHGGGAASAGARRSGCGLGHETGRVAMSSRDVPALPPTPGRRVGEQACAAPGKSKTHTGTRVGASQAVAHTCSL